MAGLKPIDSLHRYFLWADRMRVHCDQVLKNLTGEIQFGSTEHIDFSLYMSFWYGELFVVIEGWKELKLEDSKIDQLLQDENHVNNLRRYRNGAFHFQKTYFDDRFMELVSEKDSVKWIRNLNQEFSRYFLDYYKSNRLGK